MESLFTVSSDSEMALFIFITFQLLLQVKSQGLPQANLTIFPTFATNEEKVWMVCGGYENQNVSECMFLAGQENFEKPSVFCNFTLTSRELIAWSQDPDSSHNNISCYYTVYGLGENATSPHSDKVSVRVKGLAGMSSLSPITEDSPTALTPNGTSEANLSTASTMDTTSLAVTSSTEITTNPITNMSSLTQDSHSLTSPANASLESTTLTETTEHASGKKYLKKMFYSIVVVATGGGIVLTGLMGICLYGCTRRPKDERIWIDKKSKKQGVSLPIAGSDSSGEEDAAFYSTINPVQSTSQPPGNSEESKQTKVELNPLYCTILTEPPVSSDSKDIYSLVTAH